MTTATAVASAAAATKVTVGNHNKEEEEEEVGRRRIFIPTLTWYITRDFLYLTQKHHLDQFRLSHPDTFSWFLTPDL
jgi:hypothetical protein